MTEFEHQANGSRASINSTDFYICMDCGACITETHNSFAARQLHQWWHDRYPSVTHDD